MKRYLLEWIDFRKFKNDLRKLMDPCDVDKCCVKHPIFRRFLVDIYKVVFRIAMKYTLIKPAWWFLMQVEIFVYGGLTRQDMNFKL